MDEIRQQIRTMLLNSFLADSDPSVLKDDQSLERTHVVDSVRMMEVFLFIEDNYGYTVEDADALPENFDSVNSIVAYIARKKGIAA